MRENPDFGNHSAKALAVEPGIWKSHAEETSMTFQELFERNLIVSALAAQLRKDKTCQGAPGLGNYSCCATHRAIQAEMDRLDLEAKQPAHTRDDYNEFKHGMPLSVMWFRFMGHPEMAAELEKLDPRPRPAR
jgi:hypothetical protein